MESQMRYLVSMALCLLALGTRPALAADAAWPDKPVSFIVASAAGGSADVLSRIVFDELGKEMHAVFVIENRPGAAGNIGMAAVKRAAPNGYTIGYGNINTLAVNPALFKKLPYDATNDFEPVGHMFSVYNVLAVRADHPAKTLAQLVEIIKKNPGKLSWGAAGIGSSGHMGGELFKNMAKIDALFVPYQGDPASLQDLLGGRIDFSVSNSSVVAPLVASGKLRALAITSPKRLSMYPELPTFDESGFKGYENVSWGGVVVPKGTSADVIAKLNAGLQKALQSEAVRNAYAKLGATPGGGSPAQFRELIVREQKKYRDLIETAKIEKLD
jgi:tripartite-type tricarboxylate transporter receptor subunit TctC